MQYQTGVQSFGFRVCPKHRRATMCAIRNEGTNAVDDAPVSFQDDPRPEPLSDGTPRHVFYVRRDESALSAKLMLWGGWKGIVSFEGMLNSAMEPVSAHGDSKEDLSLLHELELGYMARGAADAPFYRFLCAPETRYSESRMPTGKDIIRELKNSENFQGVQLSGTSLDVTRIPFPLQSNHGGDKVHTDPEKQHMFVIDSMRDERESMSMRVKHEKSIAAHRTLRSYVLDNHLYYVVFHTKKEYEDDEFADTIYVFAIGVSPHSGNLIGVFSMNVSEV